MKAISEKLYRRLVEGGEITTEDADEVYQIRDDLPCMDPTCGCCMSWTLLDDENRDVIHTLVRTIERDMPAIDSELLNRARANAEPNGYVSRGAELILVERYRQVTAEGFSPDHDAEYIDGELKDAAIAYAMSADDRAGDNAVDFFPSTWDRRWWKPGDQIRSLAKAGALIAAEIDRILATRRV